MYVSMEMVRVINSQFINNDMDMYNAENGMVLSVSGVSGGVGVAWRNCG